MRLMAVALRLWLVLFVLSIPALQAFASRTAPVRCDQLDSLCTMAHQQNLECYHVISSKKCPLERHTQATLASITEVSGYDNAHLALAVRTGQQPCYPNSADGAPLVDFLTRAWCTRHIRCLYQQHLGQVRYESSTGRSLVGGVLHHLEERS